MRLANGRGQQRMVRCVAAQSGGEIYELRGGGGPQRARRGGEHLVMVRVRVRAKAMGLGLGVGVGIGIGSG